MLNETYIRQVLERHGIVGSSHADFRDSSVNDLPDRRVLAVSDRCFVKVYSSTAHDRYERELAILALDVPGLRTPELLHASFDTDRGGLIAM